jgi:hypothetical protein
MAFDIFQDSNGISVKVLNPHKCDGENKKEEKVGIK